MSYLAARLLIAAPVLALVLHVLQSCMNKINECNPELITGCI